jgi:predicted nucleotidyltransferase
VKITRQHLIDLARNEALKRADLNNVLSAYLIGSVASGDPLLGDTADIDLVLIHQGEAPSQRETVRLSHQVHFDI